MNKKSLFALMFAFVLLFSAQTGLYAEKDSDNSNKTVTEENGTDLQDDNKSDQEETSASEEGEFPELHTDYYLLADLDTGKVLYSKNGDEKVYPASTTKILTAILALENCTLTDVVTATEEAISPINMKHSNMGILIGEELTVEQLLYGMLVHSANDAANVLAVHVAGSLDEFVKMMNERAKELGAENTHFTNAHGFHDDQHYTTVNDMAKFACYAMKNEKFQEIVSTARYQIPPTNKYKEIRYLSNTNMMISANRTSKHIYDYAIGVKTGSTDEAGYCLVAAAEKNGTRLLSVVMKCANEGIAEKAYSFTDSRAMLDYGFEKYEHKTIASPEDVVESSKVREAKGGVRVSLSPEQTVRVLLPKDTDMSLIEVKTQKEENIKAPVEKGDILGSVSYELNGEVLGSVKLVAANAVERDLMLHIIYTVWDIISDPVVIVGAILLIILVLYARSVRRRKRRIRRSRLSHFDDDDDKSYSRRKK